MGTGTLSFRSLCFLSGADTSPAGNSSASDLGPAGEVLHSTFLYGHARRVLILRAPDTHPALCSRAGLWAGIHLLKVLPPQRFPGPYISFFSPFTNFIFMFFNSFIDSQNPFLNFSLVDKFSLFLLFSYFDSLLQ